MGSSMIPVGVFKSASGPDAERAEQQRTLEAFLGAHPSVQVIVTRWVDLCGVVRARLLPVSSFRKLVAAGGHLNSSILDELVSSMADFLQEIFQDHFTGRGRILPDLSTLRVAAHDGWSIGNAAVVFASVEHYGRYDYDARTILKGTLERAEKEDGMSFLVGIELEFCFLKPGSAELAGLDGAVFEVGDSAALRTSVWPALNEIAVALSEAGIDIEQIIKEHCASQWELSLPPLPPLEAVDAYVFAREVVKDVARKHGVLASFYPVLHIPGGDGFQTTGQHIHISATPVRELPDWDPDTLMAGILCHIPALMAIGQAQVDSYGRVGLMLGTGSYLGWGDGHRGMPIRRIAKDHWEVRTHDGTANPYAMVAGVIAAALDRKPLTAGNAQKANMSDEDREAVGITQLLPTSLEQALEELEKDRAWIEAALGRKYVHWYLLLKRAEIKALSGMDESAREARLKYTF